MKINWGTAIVLAFIGFISFILYFVISMNTNYRAQHDLVTEDYYRAELAFQNEIDDQNNATKNDVNLSVVQQEDGLIIQFPAHLNFSEIKGTVSVYRPSNKKLDFDMELKLTGAQLLIPAKRFVEGRWDIKVSWKYENESYLFKDKITY